MQLLRGSSTGLARHCLPTWAVGARPVCTYTNESSPVPGSAEDADPTGWAKRLFRLAQLKAAGAGQNISPPSPVFAVCRVKPLRGVPHYQRALLEKYNLGRDVRVHTWRVVKNVPSVCDELSTIKHLLRVQPVLFPQGMPTKEDNLADCRLLPDGRFLRYSLRPANASIVVDSTGQPDSDATASVPDADAWPCDRGHLSRAYLRAYYNRQWRGATMFSNFFTSHYKYKLNQDGQAYRYSRLWRLDDAQRQANRQMKAADGTFKQPNQNRFEANWSTYPWARH